MVRQKSKVDTAAGGLSVSNRLGRSAQKAAKPNIWIVGDSIIRNIGIRATLTYCFPQAMIADVNKQLSNVLTQHKSKNRIVILLSQLHTHTNTTTDGQTLTQTHTQKKTRTHTHSRTHTHKYSQNTCTQTHTHKKS